MARARVNELRTSGGGTASSRGVPGRSGLLAVGAFLTAVAALNTLGPSTTPTAGPRWFLDYYGGVFCLVTLSITVMTGLAVTDRMVLMIRHRVLLQSVHRALGLTAMLFLALHVIQKVTEGHAAVVDVALPFMAEHRPVYVGFGTLASYLMILVTWTGIARRKFAGRSYVWLWRVLHSSAYPCWLVALLHGLKSGRPAATWVTVSYLICGLLVAIAVVARLLAAWSRRTSSGKAQIIGTINSPTRTTGAPASRELASFGASPATGQQQFPETFPEQRAVVAPDRRSGGRVEHYAGPPARAAGRHFPEGPAVESRARWDDDAAGSSDPRLTSDEEFLAFLRGGSQR